MSFFSFFCVLEVVGHRGFTLVLASNSGHVSRDADAIRIRNRVVRCERPTNIQNPNPAKEGPVPERVSTGVWCVPGLARVLKWPSNPQNCRQKETILEKGTLMFLRQTLICTKVWFKRDLTFLFPPRLAGSQELVLKVPNQGQFHTAIRVTPRRCDSCVHGGLRKPTVSWRNLQN